VQALLAFQTARARDYFARAARALSPAETKRLAAAEIMGAIYRELLSSIERHRYDVFSEIIRVPRPLRAWIALRTWARVHYLPARCEAKTTTVNKEEQQDDVVSS
jgi:phytoene synthase